jgi:hypothetical protein
MFWIAPLVVMGIGVFPMPYGYYMLLRLVVCACSLLYTFRFAKKEKIALAWIFGFLAVLYNPLIPIHLYEKNLWTLVNIITAVIFLVNRQQ